MSAPPEDAPGTAFAASWKQTGSLDALRECTDVGGRVRGVVARRPG
jgi:hypothetical protein